MNPSDSFQLPHKIKIAHHREVENYYIFRFPAWIRQRRKNVHQQSPEAVVELPQGRHRSDQRNLPSRRIPGGNCLRRSQGLAAVRG